MPDGSLKPLSIFVAISKDAPLPAYSEYYIALGTGGYKPSTNLRVLSDNVGESISEKNRHYSELTGWYWIWKNVTDVSILGLCHYRRYFVLDENEWWLIRRRNRRNAGLNIEGRFSLMPKPEKIHFHPNAQSFGYITAPERARFVEDSLSRFDVIVPRRQWLGTSLSEHYIACHVQEDWELFIQGIQELYPQYSAKIPWFDETPYLHPYNMMIATKTFFDTYMSILFTLLFWIENKRPFRTDPYQCRVPAFLAERFFTFYLHVTGARCAEVPVAISDVEAF
jgi:hypothetical protein